MRQLHDMPASTASTVLVHAGALALAFGTGMTLTGRPMAWLVVAGAGVLAVAVGAALRKPSQSKAYEAYLARQDARDVTAALIDKSMDPASLVLVKAEARRRSTD